jgi:hypothetical protein
MAAHRKHDKEEKAIPDRGGKAHGKTVQAGTELGMIAETGPAPETA